MPQLLSILDLEAETVERIIDTAINAAQRPLPRSLEGRHVGLWFSRPSTRTRSAFTFAAGDLGASVIHYQPAEMQLSTGETIADTAAVFAQYLDVLAMRVHSHAELQPFIDAGVPLVINALNDEEHPTQALADLMTLRQTFGRWEGVRVLFLGDGGNIATSLLFAGARIPGLELHFVTPQAYGFAPGVWERAVALADHSGAKLHYHHDPSRLPCDVDAVYTTRWRSMGEEKPDPNWREQFEGFQVNESLLARTAHNRTQLMHDLPAEHGAEIAHGLLNSSHSLVWHQARNKLETARALLHILTPTREAR